jgi:MFS family permease
MFAAKLPGQSAPLSRTPVLQGAREYLDEMRRNRALATIVALTAAVEVVGFSYQAALPSLAHDVLDVGPEGLGLLTSATAAGGIVGILLLSLRGEPASRGRAFLAVLLLFGAAIIFLGNGNSLVVAVVALALVSSCAALTDVFTQTLVQAAVPNELRGRAMGSWILAIGFGPVGHLQVGAIIALSSVSAALTLNGALLVLLATVTILKARRVRDL